jgi:hypothetical protein
MLGGLLGLLPYLQLLQGLQQAPQAAAASAAAGMAMLSQQPVLAQALQSMLPGPLGSLLQQQLRPAGSVPGDVQQLLLAAAAGAAGSSGGQQQQQQQLAALMAAAAAKQRGCVLDAATAAAEPRGSGDGVAGLQQQQQQQLSGILPLFGAGVPASAAADGQRGAATDSVPGSDAYAALAGLWRSAGAAAIADAGPVAAPPEQQPATAAGTRTTADRASLQQQPEQGNALLVASLSQRFSSDATATVETAGVGAAKIADEYFKQQQQQQGRPAIGQVTQEASAPADTQQQQRPRQHHVDADDDEVEALMALGQLGRDLSGQQQQQALQQQWSQGGGNCSKRPGQGSDRGGQDDKVRLWDC